MIKLTRNYIKYSQKKSLEETARPAIHFQRLFTKFRLCSTLAGQTASLSTFKLQKMLLILVHLISFSNVVNVLKNEPDKNWSRKSSEGLKLTWKISLPWAIISGSPFLRAMTCCYESIFHRIGYCVDSVKLGKIWKSSNVSSKGHSSDKETCFFLWQRIFARNVGYLWVQSRHLLTFELFTKSGFTGQFWFNIPAI